MTPLKGAMLLLFSILVFLGSCYGERNERVRRQADRMVGVDLGNFSTSCSVTCGGGVMVRTALCLDQADTLFGLCGDQPCCSLNSFINSTTAQFSNYERCNTQACPGGPASVLGFVPHTRTLSHDGGSSVVTVTVSGTTQTNISIVTTVTSPASTTLAFLTRLMQSGGTTTVNFELSQSAFTPTFSVTNQQIVINGRSLFPAAPFSTVRTIAPAGDITFTRRSAIYTLGTGTGIASFTGVSPYYYVSPMGHLYEYPDTKPVKDKAPGKFFRRRGLGTEFIITSENSFITTSLSRFSGSAFTIVPVANGAAIAFNFQNSGTTNFMVSSSTSLIRTVAPTSYGGRTLMVGSQAYSNIDTLEIAGEGFESYEGGTTAFSTYDAYYFNGRRVVFSTSARLSSMIQEGQMFLAGGGTATAGFRVEGNKVLYSGVTVFTITPSTSSTSVNGPATVRYEGQTLTPTGGSAITGVTFFSYNPPPLNDGFAINGGASVALAPNTAATIYRSGTEALLTNSDTLRAAITAAQQPTTIPRNTASYATILRQGTTGILQLNGNDVVAVTGSVMTLTLRDNDRIRYNAGTISIMPPDSRGPFNGITSFTYAPAGQSIQRFINTVDRTFNVDSSYQLLVDGSGRALLANDAQVKALVANPQFSVTFGSRDSQGRFPFMLGGSTIQTFGRNTVTRSIPIGGRLRLVNDVLSGTDQNAVNLFQATVSSITTFFGNERVPGTLTSPASITATSPYNVYVTGGSAFITDRSSLQIAIDAALVEPPPTTLPPPTTAPTTPPTTMPPVRGRVLRVVNDGAGNPIVMFGDMQVISLTGSKQRNISSTELVSYGSRVIRVTDSNSQELLRVMNIDSFFYYDMEGVLRASSSYRLRGSGLLVYNEVSGTALFTNNPEAIEMISAAMPPTMSSGGTTMGPGGETILTIGGAQTVPIIDDKLVTVSSVQTVQLISDGYTILNPDGSVAERVTGESFNRLVQYDSMMDQPMVSVLNSSIITLPGPQRIAYDEGTVVVTNRSDVNNVIDSVTPSGSQTVQFRMTPDGNTILVIGGRDIITINQALVRRVEFHEYLRYFNSTVTGTNVVTNMTSGSPVRSTTFTTYTTTDNEPVVSTGSSPSSPPGLGYLFHTHNESFFTNRPDVFAAILSMFNMTSTLPPPPPTATPKPGEETAPEEVPILNSDGSSWTNELFMPCSRTCGGGVRVRQSKCQLRNGTHVATCTVPTEPSSTDIPSHIEVCNAQDCPGGEMRNGIPTPDVFEINMTFSGQPSGQQYGRGVVYVESSVPDDTYMITFLSRCLDTGSMYSIVQEKVNGAIATYNNIGLETGLVRNTVTSTVDGYTIFYNYNGAVFPVTVIMTNGIPPDEVVLTSGPVSYVDNVLTFDGRNISDITAVTKMDSLQAIRFESSFPNDEPGPALLCISYRLNEAVISREFIREGLDPYNALRNSLRPPMIDETRPTPPPPLITESNDVFQIGTPNIRILEQLHKFSLSCRVSDSGNPDQLMYIWRKDGNVIINDNVNYLISGDTLTIQTTDRPDDAGTYSCTVINGAGSDTASTVVMIEEEIKMTTPPPTTPPPPQPMWVTFPFSDCSKTCNGGVRVRSIICQLSGQQSQACNVSTMPLSFELCNTRDCPGEPTSRRGIPENDMVVITRTIPNGNHETTVTISISDSIAGTYRLELVAVYPDGTVVINNRTRLDFGTEMDAEPIVRFGTPLFGKLEAIKTLNRIDIVSGKVVFSIQPLQGDVCYPFGEVGSFVFSDKTIYSEFIPAPVSPINHVIQITHDGVFTFGQFDSKVFNETQLLCISPFFGRAFVTNVRSLADDITGNYYNVTETYFRVPEIASGNGTVTTRSIAMVQLGSDVIAENGSYIRIQARMAEPGVPQASTVVWRHNGAIVESDISKGRFITDNGFELVIMSLEPVHAGTYSFMISNTAGSDREETDVTYMPREGISVAPVPPGSNASILNVGIGLNYGGIDASVINRVQVFCPNASTDGTRRFTINGGNEMETDVLRHGPLSNHGGTCVRYVCRLSVSGVSQPFSRMSVVCFENLAAPSNVMIAGNRMLVTGGSTLLTCNSRGYPPPTEYFDVILPGSNGIMSDFTVYSNGSISIFNAKNNDNTMYCCRAFNSEGSVLNCTTITVMSPPMILRVSSPATNAPLPHGVGSPLSEFTYHIGQNARVITSTTINIECNTTGSPAPTYEWRRDGEIITGDTNMGRVLRIELANAQNHAGLYECAVRNNNGFDSVRSTLEFLRTPNVPDSMTTVTEIVSDGGVVNISQGASVKVRAGVDFCIMCNAYLGDPAASEISWRRRSISGTQNEGIDVNDVCITFRGNGTLLCFTDITTSYDDTYTCFVGNEAGSDSGNVTVQVSVPPVIKQPDHPAIPAPGFCDDQTSKSFVHEDVGVNLCVSVGTTVLLDCEVNADACPAPNVTWLRAGTLLTSGSGGVTIFPNNSLLISSGNINTTYACVVTPPPNFYNPVNRSSSVTFFGVAPSIAVSPSDNAGRRRIISVGSGRREIIRIQLYNETQILCDNAGSPAPSISWTVGGRPVTSDNVAFGVQPDGSLLIRSLQSTTCANYTCSARNALGTVSSSVIVCGESYRCVRTGFSECTTTCGLGAQRYIYSCNRTVDNVMTPIPYNAVPFLLRPPLLAQSCNNPNPCPGEDYRYVATDYSPCSHSCNCGKQSRSVECYLFKGGVQVERVDYLFCQSFANHSMFPSPLTRDCNVYPCPDWLAGPWGACNRTCSGGFQVRNITCYSNASNMTIDDRFCNSGTILSDIRMCNTHPCPYKYVVSRWSECSSTCRGGIRTRQALCYNVMTQQYIDDALCRAEGLSPPITTHVCGVGECAALYSWVVGHYGSCSVTCGIGRQTRSVHCENVINQERVDDSFCSRRVKPQTARSCNTGVPCPGADCTSESFLCSVIPRSMCSVDAVRAACCLTCPSSG